MKRVTLSWKNRLLTLLSDLFLLWVLLHFGMGGLEGARALLPMFGLLGWALLALVVFLLLYRSDYRTDLPLFAAGCALGYWGEWWGTTRGVWTYWNGAMPPDYLPPLWGLGLVTAYRLSGFWKGWLDRPLPRWVSWCMAASFIVLPVAGVLASLPALTKVDWSGRLDLHFFAGLLVGAALVALPLRPAASLPAVCERDAAGRALRVPRDDFRRMDLHHRRAAAAVDRAAVGDCLCGNG